MLGLSPISGAAISATSSQTTVYQKALTASSASLASMKRKISKKFSAVSTSSAVINKLKARLALLTVTSTFAVKQKHGIKATKIATSTSTSTLNRIKAKIVNISAGSAVVAKRVIRVNLVRKATTSSITGFKRGLSKTMKMAEATATKMARGSKRSIVAVQSSVARIKRKIATRMVASQLTLGILFRSIPLRRTLLATAASTGRIARGFKKALSATTTIMSLLIAARLAITQNRASKKFTIFLKQRIRKIKIK